MIQQPYEQLIIYQQRHCKCDIPTVYGKCSQDTSVGLVLTILALQMCAILSYAQNL